MSSIVKLKRAALLALAEFSATAKDIIDANDYTTAERERDALPADAANRPTIVCLCGSTRFSDAFREANLRETLEGKIVLSIGCDLRTDNELWADPDEREAMKVTLDELHKRKIDLADEVLILNVGGYIGTSTQSELDYAIAHNKVIRYLDAATPEAALGGVERQVIEADQEVSNLRGELAKAERERDEHREHISKLIKEREAEERANDATFDRAHKAERERDALQADQITLREYYFRSRTELCNLRTQLAKAEHVADSIAGGLLALEGRFAEHGKAAKARAAKRAVARRAGLFG